MTVDVTELVLVWVKCCNELWLNWFKKHNSELDRFSEVEEQLFRYLVVDMIGCGPSQATNVEILSVRFADHVTALRQVCRTQKAGNIFCRPENVSFIPDTPYGVAAIDPTGAMMGGEPYVEISYDGGRVLEPVGGVRYFASVCDPKLTEHLMQAVKSRK